MFREYFSTVVPPQDNKYAALNSAVWSGGSFVYIPILLPKPSWYR
jgi:Fe-S cluster assembly protein SufB